MSIMQTALITLEQSCLYFPLVLGAYISISLMKLPDLSIEAAYLFGALLATRVMLMDIAFPNAVILPVVLLVSVIGGIAVGCISSTLTRYAKIPHLLSSILTVGLFHGLSQLILGSSMVSLSKFADIMVIGDWFVKYPELPLLFLIMVGLLGSGYFFFKTQLGYSFAVFGDNPHFFEHHRISTNYVVMTGIMLANGLAGLSGYFVAQTSGFVDINAGHGIALFCITALILGKTFSFTNKFLAVRVPLVGTLSYFVIIQLLLQVGFNQKYFTMVQAGFVILILVYKYRLKGRRMMADHLGV